MTTILGRAIAVAVLAFSSVLAAAPAEEFEFAEITIETAQARMQRGELSAEQLTHAYLARIEAIDRAGPTLRAVIEVNPDARFMARALDEERRKGRVRGPLHGIPVLIKDNIATADGMETTAGSVALVGLKPDADAALVTRLREAGAVILGKTNLSEWANMRSLRSVSGWSSRGGQTRNPYALDQNPSGSSSGSAVAVAANLCVVAVGTETDGSIVSPSSANGIVGLKPTVGRVSRSGIIPISASQDTAGPMARTVRDAAILLAVLAGADERDPATKLAPDGGAWATPRLSGNALRGARLGVVRGPFGLHPKTDAVLERAREAMRAAGAEIVELGEFPAVNEAADAELTVLLYEFKDGLNRYLAGLGSGLRGVRSLADLIAFNEAQAGRLMASFGQDLFVEAEKKGSLTDGAYREAREKCVQLIRGGVEGLMKQHRVDALVTVTAGPAWLIDHVNGDAYTGGSSTLAAVSGFPSVTVPAGSVEGLPVGILFTGLAWSEVKLLELAHDFESRTHARRLPEFRNVTGVR